DRDAETGENVSRRFAKRQRGAGQDGDDDDENRQRAPQCKGHEPHQRPPAFADWAKNGPTSPAARANSRRARRTSRRATPSSISAWARRRSVSATSTTDDSPVL